MLRTLCCALVVALSGAVACAQSTVGWRGDGLSRYPEATPVTEWSPSTNVVWKTPLPTWSNATPVLLPDRIFICGEPTDLICVNKADGKILWTRSNNYDLVQTADEKADAEKAQAEQTRIRVEELEPLKKELDAAQAEMNKLEPPTTATATAVATAPATTAPSPEAVAAVDAAKKKIQAINKSMGAANKKIRALAGKWGMPGTHEVNGHSSATPVCDGKVVATVFNNGVAACYDLDGNLKWAKFIAKPPKEYFGSCSSPLICQNQLIIYIDKVVALDLATGAEVWRASTSDWRFGTSALARVGNLDVLITANGDVIRVSDGKVLINKLCALEYDSPIFRDSVAYFIQANGKAVKLSPKGDDDVQSEVLWTTRPKDERYYGSPLIEGELIYDITRYGNLSAIAVATGKVAWQTKFDFGKSEVYPSIALAGKYLFVSSDDGTTMVLEAGKELKVVAKNTLEQFRCTPVFEGSRMYIRGYKNLYCIGK